MEAETRAASSSALSFWMDASHRSSPALDQAVETDVVVVGAGYTGLSTALALREAGLSVAVLERDVAGSGASGRNCGQVGADLGKSLTLLRRHLGLERAREAAAYLKTAIAYLEGVIRDRRIDCAWEPVGNVFAGIHPSQSAFFERAARNAEALGIPVRVLTDADLRAKGLPAAIVCGYHEQIGGSLDPGRYVRGLRRAALESGALLFERSPVRAIDDARLVHVRTSRGGVRARFCVLATNAYTPQLGWLRRKLMPAAVSALVTNRLSDAQRERLGWAGREPLYTAHHVLENLRWTHDDRLLVGTKRVRVGFGTLPPGGERRAWEDLERVLRERFPELGPIGVAQRWTGWVALTADFLPVFGRTGRHGNVFYGGGYGGHGVSLATYAGRTLCDLVLERDPGPSRVLVDRRVPPIPPEPLRWLATQAFLGTMMYLDRRVDRRARALGRG